MAPESEWPEHDVKPGSNTSDDETKAMSRAEFLGPTDSFTPVERESDPWIGRMIGNYHVLSRLGSGGFGAVYKARDTKLERYAAIKVLRTPLDMEHRSLFASEGKILASLSKHPNIVQIYTWGEESEQYYFVLEYLDGNAQKLIDEHPEGVPVERALRAVRDCAEALVYAHGRNVLHRDIKPENILFDEHTGRAKLCDFGLAKFFGTGDSETGDRICGTPPYMSPEQASGQRLDERSDVYSLGVALYKLLSGQLPYPGESAVEVISKIQSGSGTPLRKHRPDLPGPVLDLVDKATAHNPEKRYQRAKEFERDVKRLLSDLERSGSVRNLPSAESSAQSRFFRLTVAAAFVLIVGGLFVANRVFDGAPEPGSNMAAIVARLNAGDFEAAQAASMELLARDAVADDVLYVHGVASLMLNEFDEAEMSFSQIDDPAARADAYALLAFMRGGPDARTSIEALAQQSSGPVTPIVLASLDVTDQKYESAVERVEPIADASLPYDWQKELRRRTLAQAYYHLGKLEEARELFEGLKDASTRTGTASAYVRLIDEQLDETRRERTSEQIARVKALLDADPPEPNDDRWTSRPVTLWVLPEFDGTTLTAAYLGLPDVLPWMISDALLTSEERPIRVVDRELMTEILAEQELSGSLSSANGRLRLGQVLGARYILHGDFGAFGDTEFFRPTLVNTESTDRLPVDRHKIERGMDVDAWLADLRQDVLQAVQEPVRGIVTREANEYFLNIGSDVGVTPGDRFAVFAGPEERFRIPDAQLVVDEVLAEDAARVRIESGSLDELPNDGWFVQRIEADENEPVSSDA